MKRSRALLLSVVPAALLATTLTACSSSANISQDAAGVECAPAGDASKSITVDGGVGETLTLSSKLPVTNESLERSVITAGSGDVFATDQTVTATYTIFNGQTGDVVNQQADVPVPNNAEQLTGAGWMYEAVRCATPGERTVVVLPTTEALGGDPAEMGISDITADDSFVIVFDFGEGEKEVELLDGPQGKTVAAPEGFPTVTQNDDGSPKITMPEGVDAPTTLSIATLIEGDGAVVEPGDRVYVNYRGVIWSTGEEFDSSWSRGEPTDFVTTQVIGGFQKALEGQTVGSQIISVVPAEDGGYGAASLEQMGHAPDAVMVFVLDILGVAPAA